MGNCCSNKNNVENTQISLITQNQNTKTSSIKGTTKVNFALKFPHGFQGIEYSENDKIYGLEGMHQIKCLFHVII